MFPIFHSYFFFKKVNEPGGDLKSGSGIGILARKLAGDWWLKLIQYKYNYADSHKYGVVMIKGK